jgi:hypothetical protein
MGTSHVFILRIWQETDHAHPHHDPALRGSLQLVSTGEVRYFSRMEQITPLLNRMTNPEKPGEQPD